MPSVPTLLYSTAGATKEQTLVQMQETALNAWASLATSSQGGSFSSVPVVHLRLAVAISSTRRISDWLYPAPPRLNRPVKSRTRAAASRAEIAAAG